MIYFIHNTYNRPKQVIETCKLEKNHFPNSKHLIVYNNNLTFEPLNNTDYFYFGENKGHKVGSINSVFSGLKWLLNNKNIQDEDLIIYSHDDTYLSNINKFNYYLNLTQSHDFISRRYINNKHNPDDCNHYIMMESFLIKPNLAKSLIENYEYNSINEKDLLLDSRNSYSPEMSFGKNILKYSTNSLLIDININNYGENDLGYFHIENERGKGEL